MPNKIVLQQNNARGQRGQVIPLTAVAMLALIGFMALAIDVGYLLVVRNELQNAADTAALAGAGYLFNPTPPSPNWASANTAAGSAITSSSNRAANAALTTGTITTGYWNVTGSPTGVQSSAITPGANDFPAVQVTITKSGANGAVNAFFAQTLGIATFSPSATGVAVVTSPGYTNINAGLFPVAIPKCMFDNFYQDGIPLINPVTGSYDIPIGSSYHYPTCSSGSIAGQWTSMDLGTNNVPTIRSLIDQASGNNPNYDPTTFNIGDNIWIEPGTKTTLYSSVDACSARGDKSCEYVTFPVICPNPAATDCGKIADDTIKTHVFNKIVGFACIHILKADGGSTKTVTVQMVGSNDPNYSKCKVSGGGVGPNYGAFLPPRLANYWGNTY